MRSRAGPFALVLPALLAAAQPAPPRVASVDPPVLCRGAEAELAFSGERLSGAAEVHVTGEGIRAAVLPGAPADGKSLRARFAVAPDAPLGPREARLVARGGVSNPVALHVGLLPVVEEREPNDSAEQAQRVAQPAAIAGRIRSAAESDFYRFEVKKDQRLIFDCFAFRIGSKLDPAIALHDAAGKELARNDDAHGLDAFLEFTAPRDGEYVLSVRDSLYAGSNDHGYRLELGAFPYVESIFPLGGPRGGRVDVMVSGRNLGGRSKMRVDLHPQEPPGRRELAAETPLGPAYPHPFEVGDLPEVVEEEGNDALAAANPVGFPAVVNGRIERPRDVDVFRFKAPDAPEVAIEVAANRFGSPLDAVLTLMDASGRVLQQVDDVPGAADPRITAKGLVKGAEYAVSIRDLVDRGGERFAYRLSIRPPRPPRPDFTARFLPDAIRVPRGGHARIWLEVSRLAEFQGEVEMAFDGLPPGVACRPLKVAAGVLTEIYVLSADPNADLGSFPVMLAARGLDGGRPIARWADPEVDNRAAGQAFVSVVEAAPFAIEPAGAAGEAGLAGVRAEIAELERSLAAPAPGLEAGQAAWEKSQAGAAWWTVLAPGKALSTERATLAVQKDGSLLARDQNPAKGRHTVVARTDLRGITAFRLEVLTDPSLPATGPGRAPNGNFVLTEFKVQAAPQPEAESGEPVLLAKTEADFAQDQFPVAAAVDGNDATGWAVAPQLGQAHAAVFSVQAPVGGEGGTTLVFTLDHQSIYGQHVIGRFRISATTAKDPARAITLPDAVGTILATPAENRSEAQKRELAAYYRSIAPELKEVRDRIALLRSELVEFPPRTYRGGAATLGVRVCRAAGFKGDVAVSVEGFSAGRDPQTRQPAPLSKNVDVAPLVLKDGQAGGVLTLKAKPASETGTRNVVLRGETKVDGQAVTVWSAAFPLTVDEKAPAPPPPPAAAALRAPDAPAALEKGVDYRYFEGSWEKLPDFDALQPAAAGGTDDFEISKRGRDEGFGFAYRGFVEIPRDGTWTFSTVSDDGSRLSIGGKVVVDNDGLHGPEEKGGAIGLRAGRHAIAVTFFELSGGEHLEVFWEGPGIAKQRLPASALFRAKKE